MDYDEETAPAATDAAVAAGPPTVHAAYSATLWALGWALFSPFIAGALLKYCVAAAVLDATRLGVFLLPMYLAIPFLGAVAVLVRWRCSRRNRGHAAYLRHLLPLGVLGGLVHVWTMVAVVALPLLPAMLIGHCDGLWLVGHRILNMQKRAGEHDEPPAVRPAELPGRAVPLVALLLFAAAVGLATLDVATNASEAHSLMVGVPAALLASIGRPVHAAMCRRAVAKRCGREVLSKKLPLPISSHRFVGFERGHLDLLDRLHGHPAYASVVLGLDAPSTFEIALISEYLFALPFGCAIPVFLLWSPIGTVGGAAMKDLAGSFAAVPGLLTSSVVDLGIAGGIGVIMVAAPWLNGMRATRVGPLHFGATRLGLLLAAGLLGSAAGGVVLTTSIGGAVLCFGTASCLHAVFENERCSILGAERVVADLVAYRDATAADVERFCGANGVLGLDGVAQRKAGVKVDAFSRVVGEQLRAHAEYTARREGEDDDDDRLLLADGARSVTPDGGGASVTGVKSPPPGPPPAADAPKGSGRTAQAAKKVLLGVHVMAAAAAADDEAAAKPVEQERRGSFLVRSSLSRQVASDLSDLARTTFADPNEVAAMFPPAKAAA